MRTKRKNISNRTCLSGDDIELTVVPDQLFVFQIISNSEHYRLEAAPQPLRVRLRPMSGLALPGVFQASAPAPAMYAPPPARPVPGAQHTNGLHIVTNGATSGTSITAYMQIIRGFD